MGLIEFQSTRPRGARLVRRREHRVCGKRFNPRARAGRDLARGLSAEAGPLFQSTRPRGARHERPRRRDVRCLVSIHAPARGATRFRLSSPYLLAQFQSTRPRGARHVPFRLASYISPCFNPRARAGRDPTKHIGSTLSNLVSIHAPARGATRAITSMTAKSWCFNPRARAGRDKIPAILTGGARCFNPRARAGRDTGRRSRARVPCDVSIHAPARGATRRTAGSIPAGVWFQSTRPRGARHDRIAAHRAEERFQSTRPRGARPGRARAQRSSGSSFNPRARAGRDLPATILISRRQAVSIHAPARGATRSLPYFPQVRFCFNPRARAGRDAPELLCGV